MVHERGGSKEREGVWCQTYLCFPCPLCCTGKTRIQYTSCLQIFVFHICSVQDSHAQIWNSLGEFCPLLVLPPLIINLPRALSLFGSVATIKWDGWMDWSFARSSSIYNVDSAQLREAPFKLTQNLFGLYWHPPPRVDGT